ncbi:MAG: zinc ABC transporter substrate-binding protein [Chloroflexota bacterium]
MVTILPQVEFVESVGGDRVQVSVMVPPGANPHVYEPAPSQLTGLSRARIYASIGSGIEFELTWLDKLRAVNREMLMVDCSAGVTLIPETKVHKADDGKSSQGAPDPHIWMSPRNAGIMVQNIYAGLVQLDPEGRDYYAQNRDIYLDRLTALDRDIRQALSGQKDRSIIVYHPVLGYFAREYNLTMLPVEEEGKEPSAADIAYLIQYAREHKIKVVFASPQFSTRSAEVIAGEIGGRVVMVDDLARDYIGNLRRLLAELVMVLE